MPDKKRNVETDETDEHGADTPPPQTAENEPEQPPPPPPPPPGGGSTVNEPKG